MSLFERCYLIRLEAALGCSASTTFNRQYSDLCQHHALHGVVDSIVYEPERMRSQLSVVFESPEEVADRFLALGYDVLVEGQSTCGNLIYRVNNSNLFWAAVRHGYLLGNNDPIIY